MQHYIDVSFPSSRVPGIGDDEYDVTYDLQDWLSTDVSCTKLTAGFGLEPCCTVQCLIKAQSTESSKTGNIFVSCVSQKYTTKYQVVLKCFEDSEEAFCYCDKRVPGEIASEVADIILKTLRGLKSIRVFALNRSIDNYSLKPLTFLKIFDNGSSTTGFGDLKFTDIIDSLAGAFGSFSVIWGIDSSITVMHKQKLEFEKSLVLKALASTESNVLNEKFYSIIENTLPVGLNTFETLYM